MLALIAKQTYGEKYNLPCIISETGVRYLMDPETKEPRAGGASEVDMKVSFLTGSLEHS